MLKKWVTPFAGVWIEMSVLSITSFVPSVTPFAGVWIEIVKSLEISPALIVTPFAGVWIEICLLYILLHSCFCHSLRGSVD